MESLKELEQKLSIAQKYELIMNHLKIAECPVCHNKGLSYKQHLSGSLDYNGSWNSKIECPCCNILKAEYRVTGYELYNMNMREEGELQMLRGCYDKIKNYI